MWSTRLKLLDQFLETEHAGHAAELIKALDFSLYSGIVTISGDGVFHEVIDAMISRPDWPTIQSIPVGIIGGGSGNGMSKNVNSVHPELACMAIINSTTLPTDIFSYVLNNELHFSHLSVTWAFIADLDIESDRYRWLGPERFTLAAIVRMVRLRTYTGRLFIRPFVEGTEKPELKSLQDFRALHPSSSAEYESWPVSFKGEFRYFMATNYRYIATDFMASPETGLNSGFMSVLWSPEMSRQQILDTLMDSSSGAYASHPQMFSQKTSAFVLEPGPFWLKRDGPVSTPGILNVSGEQVPYCPISVVLHPGLLSCFVYDQ